MVTKWSLEVYNLAVVPLTPKEQNVTIQVIGIVLIVVGLYAASQPGNSILIGGILVGIFMVLAPTMFTH